MGYGGCKEQTNQTMKILVIIVTYNGTKWINRCFDSLRASSVPVTTYVVDNKSTDETVALIKSQYPEVILHENTKNLGFGGANNIGMIYALMHDYDYVYLLNQDAWLMPDTLEKLIDIHRENPCYGVLSPMQTNAEMTRLDPNFANITANNSSLISDYVFGSLKSVYHIPFVMAAHWLISRECLQRVGLFSPVFFHYGEDDNYLQRVHYFGLKVGLVPEAQAVHDREFREMSKSSTLLRLTSQLFVHSANINISFLPSFIKSYTKFVLRSLEESIRYRDGAIILKAMWKIFSLVAIYQDRQYNKYKRHSS